VYEVRARVCDVEDGGGAVTAGGASRHFWNAW